MSSDRRREEAHEAIAGAADALAELADVCPELAAPLSRLVTAVSKEAMRTKRFSATLMKAIGADQSVVAAPPSRRTGRRNAGAIDPFATYEAGGEANLRDRLETLSLEQLRDIVAEQGMDNDRLAMKWKDPQRVIERITERVVTRAAKGSAFRSAGA